MKLSPLDEILKQITPLPYQANEAVGMGGCAEPAVHIVAEGSPVVATCKARRVLEGPYKTNAAYLAHAANVLPELVEALQAATLAMMEKAPGEDERQTSERRAAYLLCTKALSLATNVPTP